MPSSQSKSTSVFHALGSYADRIKDQESLPSGSVTTASASSSTSPSPSPAAGNKPLPDSISTSASASASVSASPRERERVPQATAPALASTSAPQAAQEEDGAWETVRVGRHRARPERQEEKRGSNSRNWRERDEKPGQAKKESSPATTTPASTATSTAEDVERRGKKEPAASSSTAAAAPTAQPRAPATSASKPAWGAATPASVNGSTPKDEQEAPAAVSTSTADKATAASAEAAPVDEKKAGSADSEGSWRARPKAPEPAPEPAPAPVVRQAAPPPAVNAWDMRKKAAATAPKAVVAPAPAPVPVPAEAAPEAKATGKKKKKSSESHQPGSDTMAWPDVSQAAEATKEDGKRAKHEKKESESSAQQPEEPAQQAGKKQKWMPIPAVELQEAADKAAETTRRQGGKTKTRGKDAEGGEGKRNGKKGGNEAKKAPRMQRSGSQGSETRIPFTDAQRAALSNGINGAAGEAFPVFPNGSLSAPLSRQESEQSKRASPSHSAVPLTPESTARELAAAPNGANLPRGPRGARDGRGAYGGRGGRGGFRVPSNVSARSGIYPELSPLQGNAELGNAFPRGYMGYGYYPVPNGTGFVVPPGYDAAQYAASMQQAYQRLPPPPLPVTTITNIDPLRYYVLGQVEYYFSIQNLAMDFFLRQQMDSQGWIELSMIASFNRIKSLTPDVAVVEEVMEISSLLELKDGMVRLAGDEAALRWVLPGARPSKFAGGSPGAAHLSPRKLAGEGAELSLSVPGGMPSAIDTLGPDALDMLHTAPNPLPKFDVENALMRNVSTNGHARLSGGDAASASSATASVLASDLASEEGKTMTPETSVAGDSKSELETDVDIEFPYKQPIDAMLAAKLAAAAGRAEAKAAEAKAAESQNL